MPPKRKSSHLSTGDTPAACDELSLCSPSPSATPTKPTSAMPKTKRVKVEKEKEKEKVKEKEKTPTTKGKAAAVAASTKGKDGLSGKESAAEKKTLAKEGTSSSSSSLEKKIQGKDGGGEKKIADKNGKEKVKAVTGDEATEVILQYLRRENRPFSAGDVSGNLHGKVTKTLTDKLLKELFNAQLIHGKGTNGDGKGSQWVYWALQDGRATLSGEELQRMEEEIKGLEERMPEEDLWEKIGVEGDEE
ncbi:hypothetical protein ACMFMG_008530 [Clarireedia jacksonii]